VRKRRWMIGVLGAVLGLAMCLSPRASVPASAADGSDVVAACDPLTGLPEAGPRACTSLERGTWVTAQGCRRVDPLQEPVCPTIDGRPVHESAMTAYEAGWLHRALGLQRALDLDVPLTKTLLPHTHNSANSSVYAPSVSNLDANQVLSLTDQLRLGMRAVEIDVHWVPHPSGDTAQGGRAVVQCHGEPVATPAGVVHAGCSVDTPLVDLLHELRTWLDAPGNRSDVVLLYLENALDDDPAAHAAAVAAIQSTLGGLVARPAAGAGCQSLPVTRTKQQLLDARTRVLITGNCGPGGWTDWVFERGPHWDESGGSTFDCAAERAGIDFESTVVRRYEDSTWLSAMAGSGSHRDAAQIAAMVQCGVNLVGFDQVYPGDDRLPGLVWSWRHGEPVVDARALCAAQGRDGRFFAGDCTTPRPVACRTAAGGWTVTPRPVPWSAGNEACATAGHARADVPFNGWDNGLLRAAAVRAGAEEVWLAYGEDATGSWVRGIPVTVDPPSKPPPRPRAGRPPASATEGPAAPSADRATVAAMEPIAAVGPHPRTTDGLALVAVALAAAFAAPVAVRRHRSGPATPRG
jgi:hypothetical protein